MKNLVIQTIQNSQRWAESLPINNINKNYSKRYTTDFLSVIELSSINAGVKRSEKFS